MDYFRQKLIEPIPGGSQLVIISPHSEMHATNKLQGISADYIRS